MIKQRIIAALLCGAACIGAFPATAALAHADAAPGDETPSAPADGASPAAAPAGSDIVVTARRRGESLIAVPVVVTAMNQTMIESRGITNLDSLARAVPQLLIGPQGGSVQGGEISIRGIAGPDSNPFGDQAVSFDIDGIQVAKSTVRRMSDFDQAQVEVYKGPQALYFGKNSMAGIVNIQTADPTNKFEAGAKVSYEPYAREVRTEGYVSGPVADGLSVRVAGLFSHMDGYLTDQTPRDSVYFNTARSPRDNNWGLRGTVKYNALSNFDAKLKVSYGKTTNNGPASAQEFVSCPLGARQFSFFPVNPDNSECKAGSQVVNAGYGPLMSQLGGTGNHFRKDGQNFQNQEQLLSGFVMHYHPSSQIDISSATGLYYVNLTQCQNYENSYALALPSCNTMKDREFSQELNVATKFDGPLNFTAGLYFSDTWAKTGSLTYLFATGFPLLDSVSPGLGGPTTPAQINAYSFTQEGKAYSAFLQTSFKPIPEVEISAGGRYTHETKRLTDIRDGGGLSDSRPGAWTNVLDSSTIVSVANGGLALDHAAWDDFSPEATINYRPSQNLTVFASYKHGFLSGGFNSSSVDLGGGNIDLSYKPQTIKGFEGGVKTRLFDGTVLFNVAAYHYLVSNLQVVEFTDATSTIRNAASSKINGVEADITIRTPVHGLILNGAAAYNRAVYASFPGAPCYNGQSQALGCSYTGTNGVYTSVVGTAKLGDVQSLAGKPVPRAPLWNLSAGFTYDTVIGSGLKLGLNGDVTYSSSYLTDATDAPNSRQPAYALLNAGIRLGSEDERWQFAVIGRNLTSKYYFAAAPDVPFTGSGTGAATGSVLGDRFATVSRGREIVLQFSTKFGR
ncbi:TonB-dependent receptor [Novosphingobium rosa]|uniref:TonB-dependent receptor n=1 Tax=Novosphingobium rosa TaxID=76978 RepID=UPI00082AC196|nr:TonB-dependent receptor [Novosphingobium rosa]